MRVAKKKTTMCHSRILFVTHAGSLWFQVSVGVILVRPISITQKILQKKSVSQKESLSQESKSEIILSPAKLQDSIKEENGHCYTNPAFVSDENLNNRANNQKKDVLQENGAHATNVKANVVDKVLKKSSLAAYKRLFKNFYFCRLMFMTLFSIMGSHGILYLLPALAKERGADDFLSALAVTVVGAAECLVRCASVFFPQKCENSPSPLIVFNIYTLHVLF